MFNIFNKKVSGRLLGTKASYSVSFTNCAMSWEKVPLLEKMARKNYPTLDQLVSIPSGRGQTKSDVVLRVFVSPTSEAMQKSFPVFLEDGSLKTQDVNKIFLPVIAAFRIKTGDYKVVKAEKVIVGADQEKSLKITGADKSWLAIHQLERKRFCSHAVSDPGLRFASYG